MARKFLGGEVPFPPLQVIDIEQSLSLEVFNRFITHIDTAKKRSILIRKKGKTNNRGGYFFHIGKSSDEVYEIYDFEGNLLVKTSKLLDLINHISGCIYSDEIYKICQEDINLRNDP